MIYRDYILRMIERYAQSITLVRQQLATDDYGLAAGSVDEAFRELVGEGVEGIVRLSDGELLARVMNSEPTAVVRTKCLILTAMLRQAADLLARQDRAELGDLCVLKGLNLLLDVLQRDMDADFPDFVPKVEDLVRALKGTNVPLPTQAALMHHYERLGEFGKAEDWLCDILESAPGDTALVSWGIEFYRRLLALSDAALLAGNLPRQEVEAGLAELCRRLASETGPPPSACG